MTCGDFKKGELVYDLWGCLYWKVFINKERVVQHFYQKRTYVQFGQRVSASYPDSIKVSRNDPLLVLDNTMPLRKGPGSLLPCLLLLYKNMLVVPPADILPSLKRFDK